MALEENLEKPLIISCAVTGSITTRRENPALPYTPQEIVQSALGAVEAGASSIHVHVREADGTPSNRAELFEEVFAGIRAQSDALICGTTASGAGLFRGLERMTALPLAPDIASFDAGSMNFGNRVFENSPAFLKSLAAEIGSRHILAEIECFDLGMIGNAVRLTGDGMLPGGGGKVWWFQLCLGVRGGAPFSASTVLAMREQLPPHSEWSILGVGRAQLPAAMLAIPEGGHVRTGLEDNIYFRKGVLAESNAQLVKRVVDLAGEVGRPVASPAEARWMLGLEGVRPLTIPLHGDTSDD
ncbi:MAG: 3-keto-5-aminohexanoate cleavage protein [Chloroflexota bacterium]